MASENWLGAGDRGWLSIEWLRRNEREIAVDPIILGEIQLGILLLLGGRRRRRLEQWFQRGVTRIQCLPWEVASGLRWAALLVELRRAGKTMSIKDSLIAATALIYELTVVTRNTKDFENANVPVVNPFL